VSIVGKFVRELGAQLAARSVTVELTEAATEYLAKKGYDPDNGARPLARVIQEEIKGPLGEELLFGALENGGHVVVDAKENAVKFYRRYGFLQLPEGQRMFIPMETIKKLIGARPR